MWQSAVVWLKFTMAGSLALWAAGSSRIPCSGMLLMQNDAGLASTRHVHGCHAAMLLMQVAMTFDHAQRRLITGGADGRVCMWNFNSGSMLREFKHNLKGQEICAVLYVHDQTWHSQEVCKLYCICWLKALMHMANGLVLASVGRPCMQLPGRSTQQCSSMQLQQRCL